MSRLRLVQNDPPPTDEQYPGAVRALIIVAGIFLTWGLFALVLWKGRECSEAGLGAIQCVMAGFR